jgi:hypothetical protein
MTVPLKHLPHGNYRRADYFEKRVSELEADIEAMRAALLDLYVGDYRAKSEYTVREAARKVLWPASQSDRGTK